MYLHTCNYNNKCPREPTNKFWNSPMLNITSAIDHIDYVNVT
jgi:hypothetical protein